jgi:hypothetical protein
MTRRGFMSEIASMISCAIFHVSIDSTITIGFMVVYADEVTHPHRRISPNGDVRQLHAGMATPPEIQLETERSWH